RGGGRCRVAVRDDRGSALGGLLIGTAGVAVVFAIDAASLVLVAGADRGDHPARRDLHLRGRTCPSDPAPRADDSFPVWSVCTGPGGPGAGAPLPAGLMPLIRPRASEPGRIFDLELPSALAAEGYRATAEPPGDQGAAAARSARPVRGSADGD